MPRPSLSYNDVRGYADNLTADRGRHWWSNTQTPGVRAKCKIRYQQLICHVLCLSTLGDAQTIEAAWCCHDVYVCVCTTVVQDSGWPWWCTAQSC